MPRRSSKNSSKKEDKKEDATPAAPAAKDVKAEKPAPPMPKPSAVKGAPKPKAPKGGPRAIPRPQKKKKAPAAAILKKQQKAKEKPAGRKKQEEVMYDDKRPDAPLPIGLRLFCKHDNVWHEVVVVERKEKSVSRTVKEMLLPGLPPIPGIPGMTSSSSLTTVKKDADEKLGTIQEEVKEEEEVLRPILQGGWGGEAPVVAIPLPSPVKSEAEEEAGEDDEDCDDNKEKDEEVVEAEEEASPVKASKGKKRKAANSEKEPHKYLYYVHFVHWDRRMDFWVERDRLALRILKPQPKIKYIEQGSEHAAVKHAMDGIVIEGDEGDEGDGVMISGKDAAKGGNAHGHGGHGNFTEEDIKAHEEATKVKNVDMIVLGKHKLTTWYYSPFPEHYNQYSTLYFCEFCLDFFGHPGELARHSARCTLRHPPGNEIYRSQDDNVEIAVFEVDGQKEVLYCQNLSYIAKLYLDHKTLEFDCFPFLFYILTEVDDMGCHIVGYFSKEKISIAKYNLACILTLPCHQRKGYGKFIISLSYELSKVEEKVGSPEKPISDLGKVSYMSYWTLTLVNLLNNKPIGTEISIEEISRKTCITTADIIETLKFWKVLVWYKGKWTYSTTRLAEVAIRLDQKEAKAKKLLEDNPTMARVHPCSPGKLHWTPYFAHKRSRNNHGGHGKGPSVDH